MKHYDVCMTIAGSDPSGGAGIVADLNTFHRLGCYGQSVITAITIQNSLGVADSHPLPPEWVEEQIKIVMDDLMPAAVKIGMVCTAPIVEAICRALDAHAPRFVVADPVMISSSGFPLTDLETMKAAIPHLIRHISLLTPNIPEAQFLTESDTADASRLVRLMSERFPDTSILVKGGHSTEGVTDWLYDATEKNYVPFHGSRVETRNTHGTGCVLSSAIAAFVAKGFSLHEAVGNAKSFLHSALEKGADYDAGKGHGGSYLLGD
ncbi:MAG: bifunctional hydroxymethylpyrimidine kinase/phosphomethylpyrimidine kinase [Alloprevotella sp.]